MSLAGVLAGLQAPPDPTEQPLPALRNDLHIQQVGTFRDGSPRYRIHDPLRNRYFELGMIDVDMLSHWGPDATARTVAQALEENGFHVQPEEVLLLCEQLMRYQLVDASGGIGFAKLRDQWRRTRTHWLSWLLHHYLFFRLPLVRPDAWLVRMLPWARLAVSAPVRWTLLVLAVCTPFLLAREWNDYVHSFSSLLTLEGLAASAVAALVAKVLHELGHAFVARHHGVRVPVMGLAFLVLWPVLYTDTSDSWKLVDHRARFRIAAAGVATELSLALVCLFLWTVTPPGALRSAWFFLSTTSILITLSINASPFMRFDGYFLLSDALDFPNLHERSGQMARWWLWKVLWGMDSPAPELLPRTLQRFLIGFAITTWIYRAFVFFGIALLVYFAFFKVLGIVLMLVELGWFIARPVWAEATALWNVRERLRPRWLRLGLLLAIVFGGLTWFAWAGESRAPGLLMAAEENRLYTPTAARVAAVHIRPGQLVAAGDVLVELEAPDLVYRAQSNEVRIRQVQGELARIPATERQRERALVLQEQLAESMSEQQAIAEELGRLTLRAVQPGRVVDVPNDLMVGRWVGPRLLLGRVVDAKNAQVRAWVSESQVRRLAVGDEVSFTSRRPEEPRVTGRVVRIDTKGSRQLPHQLLSTAHGGELTATQNARNEWELRETVYQVDLQLDAVPPPTMLDPGRLHVPTGPLEALGASMRQLLTVLVRESGF